MKAPIRVSSQSIDVDGDWDRLVGSSVNGTFLHTRRFLAHQGDRFEDQSLMITRKDVLRGVFPAARDLEDPKVIVSHPGITYGGLVHDGDLRGEKALHGFDAVADEWLARGFSTLRYKAIPRIYHLAPAEDDIYALFRLGARKHRCDLGVAIDLFRPLPRTERRRRGLSKAERSGLRLETGAGWLSELWTVLEANLLEQHGVKPTHTLSEMELLCQTFPESIEIVSVLDHDGVVVAGAVLFRTVGVVHSQYIANSVRGGKTGALDLLFDRCITEAQTGGTRFFSFGTSTEDGGMKLNSGLYDFKAEFGGAGIVYESYELDLRRSLR